MIKIVVIRLLEKNISESHDARLTLVISESYASLDEKYELEASTYETSKNDSQTMVNIFTWKELTAMCPNQEETLGANHEKFSISRNSTT